MSGKSVLVLRVGHVEEAEFKAVRYVDEAAFNLGLLGWFAVCVSSLSFVPFNAHLLSLSRTAFGYRQISLSPSLARALSLALSSRVFVAKKPLVSRLSRERRMGSRRETRRRRRGGSKERST
jgi:hypothetical protein